MIGGLQGLQGLAPRRRDGSSRAIPVVALPGWLGFRVRNLSTVEPWWRVAELEAYPDENYGGTKYATSSIGTLTGAYIQSGNTGGEVSSNAFDGNLSSQWSSESSAIGRYVGIEYTSIASPPSVSVADAVLASNNPASFLYDYVDDVVAFWASRTFPIKSARYRTYVVGGHEASDVALDLRMVDNFGRISWKEMATVSGATTAATWYGWPSL